MASALRQHCHHCPPSFLFPLPTIPTNNDSWRRTTCPSHNWNGLGMLYAFKGGWKNLINQTVVEGVRSNRWRFNFHMDDWTNEWTWGPSLRRNEPSLILQALCNSLKMEGPTLSSSLIFLVHLKMEKKMKNGRKIWSRTNWKILPWSSSLALLLGFKSSSPGSGLKQQFEIWNNNLKH